MGKLPAGVRTQSFGDGRAKARAGRPTAARVEAIDTEIMDAARAMFLDAGYEQASMEAVAQRAGVSKGTLYARYPNKLMLLRAVYERHAIEWLGRRQRDRETLPEKFEDRLRLHARRIVGSLGAEEVRAFRHLVRRADAADPSLVRVFTEIGYAPTIDDLAVEFERGGRALGFEPRNPRRVAEMFVAALIGWHDAHDFRGAEATPEEEDAYADHVIAVIVAGAAAW